MLSTWTWLVQWSRSLRRAFESVASRRYLAPLLAALAVLWVWSPFFRTLRVDNRHFDWSIRSQYIEYAVSSLFRYGEFPLWVTDPECEQIRARGLHVFFANPETEVISPFVPLYALFGMVVTEKLAIFIHLSLGAWGCAQLLRHWVRATPPVVCALAAVLFLATGAFTSHLFIGHVQFQTTALFPWCLYFHERASERRIRLSSRLKWAAAHGALLAYCYFSGNVHPLLQYLLGLTVYVGLRAMVEPRRAGWHILGVGVAGLLFGLLVSCKLLPALQDYRGYRAWYLLAYDTWNALLESATALKNYGQANAYELDSYVGLAGLVGLAAVLLPLSRAAMVCSAVGVGLLALCVRTNAAVAKSWPLLDSQGGFNRFRLVALMFLALGAASNIARILAWTARCRWTRRWLSPLVHVMLAVVLVWLVADVRSVTMARNVEHLGAYVATQSPWIRIDALTLRDLQTGRQITAMPSGPRVNGGRYELGDSKGHTLLLVGVNRNHPGPHFGVDGGQLLHVDAGWAVQSDPNAHELRLHFEQERLTTGTFLSVAGLLLVGLIWVGPGRWRVRSEPGRRAPARLASVG